MPPYFDYREESETEEESGQSEEESSNDDKGIEDDSEDKMYINENKKIRTRNPPKSLANIMSKLTDAQIGTLKDMGFGSFIGYKINRVPTALARWLLLNYDPRTSVLEAGDVKIKITSQTVHDIFGLPMGGKEIVELNQAKKTDEVIEEWRVHFKGLATIKPSDVAKRILEREDDAGRIFKLNFLVLFVTQMMNSTKCGTVNQTFLTCLKKGMDIKKLDWCGYLLKCLKRTKTLWKGGIFNGPSTFLTVLYAQKCMPMVLKRSSTVVITKWTARKLIICGNNTRKRKDDKVAAKNVVSQSPIKVVNLGDISRKASNGISNTPKDAQVTASGLRNKFTMLEVLMNGNACDLAKAIQQHPGDEEIEYIKLQWKEKILKRASEMNVKDKERPCEQIFEVDRDWVKLSKILALTPKTLSSFDAQFDPVQVVSTMEEPSSVLPANDIPSFDLGITPTPPDVNVNADKQDVSNEEPILDIIPLTFTRISAKIRLPQKKAKEQESTTIASATTASNTAKFEAVYNSVKDRSSVLLLNDGPSFDLGLTPTPPYVNLHTDTEPMLENERVKKNEKELGPTNTITAFDVVPLSFAMPNATLVCNFEERLRSLDSMRRLFCHSSMISEKTLNEKNNVKALSYFIDDMEFVMKSAKVDNISNIDMVFFPVLLAKCHYYLLVFNLKTPKIEILDNSKNGINVSVDDLYGESFKKLKKLFIEYLAYSEHRSWKSMKKAVCERIEMSWKTEYNNEGWEQKTQIYDLRKKYLSKILKSDLNCKRTVLLNELDQFRKLPYEERVKFLKDRIVRIQNRVKILS
ncbi:ulp1 protease family, C-terminal catalytic domain-containing protein [Tanacetum coccineum]